MDVNLEDKTVWQIISDTLTENGIDVFPPAGYKGECKKEYVVLKQDGGTPIGVFSSERIYFRFELRVPKEKYSFLSVYENQVKAVLDSKLYPMIMPYGQTEPDYFDDNQNAHMRTFLYYNNRRNKHL